MGIKGNAIYKVYQQGKHSMEAIKSLDLTIDTGEFVSIVGPSGSGKTTLLYLLSGLEVPTSGTISILGRNLTKMSEKEKAKLRQDEISFVFQFYNLIPSLTVKENLLVSRVVSKKPARWTIEECLDWVGLKGCEGLYPHQLSGGMQQRVAIARSMMNDPTILFADEPIGNLDVASGHGVMALFKRLNEMLGTTIVLVTHNEDMVTYGKRVIRLVDGRVVSDETLAE